MKVTGNKSVYEDASGSDVPCQGDDNISIQEEPARVQEEQFADTPRRSEIPS